MAIELLGVQHFVASTDVNPVRGVFDRGFVTHSAQAHEAAGYDAVLIGQNAIWPDPLAIASHIAAVTERLQFLIAHRPGFVAPTMAARAFATIDQLSGGRARAHIICAASDIETQADGDFLTKEARYRRAGEYVEILRRVWSSSAPFDHDGAAYTLRNAFAEIKPAHAIPVSWAGTSEVGIAVGAAHADVYALAIDSLATIDGMVRDVRRQAAHAGRTPDFLLSTRVIVADTEAQAWDKAQAVLDGIQDFMAQGGQVGREKANDAGVAALLRSIARDGEMIDARLWRGISNAIKGRAAATALVGSTEQVVEALMRYYDLGITKFLFSGFDGLADVVDAGHAFIPMLRDAAAKLARR